MDIASASWLFGLSILATIALRVWIDPIHESRTQRLGWALFAGILPAIGYFAFLLYRASRNVRQARLTVPH
jgi:hypothetical protein